MVRINRKIHLFWYRHPEGHGNFGDELNPYIIERLSGRKVVQAVPYFDSKINIIKTIFYLILKKKSFQELVSFKGWNNLFNRKIILPIGSIISTATDQHIVWGSGIMSEKEEIRPSKFLAVRGKYTQKRLKELGCQLPNVLGDPGLLLPLVYDVTPNKKYKVGLIPHYVHYEALRQVVKNNKIKVINLLDPIEKITDEINCCELTLSTSLHGIIVSHAYAVPSRWASFDETEGTLLAGDNIKFWDYYSSVDLPEMEVLQMGSAADERLIEKSLEELNHKRVEFLVDTEKIKTIQKALLNVAPFPLRRSFRKWKNKEK